MHKSIETVRSAFGLLWRGLDQARRLFANALFLVLVLALVVWLLADDTPEIPEKVALVLAPDGRLVEQLGGTPRERALDSLLGEPRSEVLMRSLLQALETAKDDERVQALLLDLNRLDGGGLAKLERVRRAVEDFKTSGKPVVAVSDYYGQSQFHVAAAADEIMLHRMGMVMIPGFGGYRRYYKEGMDRFGVEANVFRVGEYKSAVEPFLRNDMSAEARESRGHYLGQLWESYKEDVATPRGLAPEVIETYARDFHLLLAEQGGDAAELALSLGLVDELVDRERIRERMIELVGEDEDSGHFKKIGYLAYRRAAWEEEKKGDEKIAVVVARGAILDGNRSPGSVGGESTSRLLREARRDDDVKAVVLRVDSPGGSTFASELIRREVELLGEAGKPVVASMGSVAASGGYWISMAADEIWASPATLTGSIGIFAMLPTFEGALAKFGVHSDGFGTGPLAGSLRADRSLPPEAAEAIRLMIAQGYREFITLAAEAREKTVDEIDSVARGRVWTGRDALELGLVDHLGGFDEALAAAATRAELEDDYRVVYLERSRSWSDRLVTDLLRRIGSLVGPLGLPEGTLRKLIGTEVDLLENGLLENGLLREIATSTENDWQMWAWCACAVE